MQRPLWASTSTKNPAYRDVLYVEELIGPDTVNTVPPATLAAFNDHGRVESRIRHDVPGAREAFARLTALGVPVERLIGELEPEGVRAFEKSYDDLLAALETRRQERLAQRAQRAGPRCACAPGPRPATSKRGSRSSASSACPRGSPPPT